MEFKLGGTRFVFSFGFFAVLALYMLFDREGIGLPALCAVALHEAGHIVMMRLTGSRIEAMEFRAFGVRLEKRGFLTRVQETAVYFGGVGVNLISWAICMLAVGWNLFAVVSLGLVLFNLLPVGRLDGGQLLRLALGNMRDIVVAERVEKIVGLVILAPMFAAAFLMLPRGNYTLLLTAMYLAAFLLDKNV